MATRPASEEEIREMAPQIAGHLAHAISWQVKVWDMLREIEKTVGMDLDDADEVVQDLAVSHDMAEALGADSRDIAERQLAEAVHLLQKTWRY